MAVKSLSPIAVYMRTMHGAASILPWLPSKSGSFEHWALLVGDGCLHDLALLPRTKDNKRRFAPGKVTVDTNGEVPQTLTDNLGRTWRLHPRMTTLHTSWTDYEVDAAARATIKRMRERGFYDPTENNCHHFVIYLFRALEKDFPHEPLKEAGILGPPAPWEKPYYTMTAEEGGIMQASNNMFSFRWRLGDSSFWTRTPLAPREGVFAPSGRRTSDDPPFSLYDRKSKSNVPPDRLRDHLTSRLSQSANTSMHPRPRPRPRSPSPGIRRAHAPHDAGNDTIEEELTCLAESATESLPPFDYEDELCTAMSYGIEYDTTEYSRPWRCPHCYDSVVDGVPKPMTFRTLGNCTYHIDVVHDEETALAAIEKRDRSKGRRKHWRVVADHS